MTDSLTKQLVRDTFENKFNKEKFTLFIKNLLNHIDDESDGAKFVYQGTYIPQVYQDSVSSLERIGKYTDPEGKAIDILIVNLKKEKSLDRARTMQRNFVAWYLDGSRGGKLKDAALVAFVSHDHDSWRFSLVKMDYKIQEAKVKKELTPAKRYSFLVGPDEKCHTAQSRLLPIINDDKNNPTLKQIEEAFNIEKVTKEFFERYRDLFLKLKESLDDIVKNDQKIKTDFEKKNVDTASFAKKLLGQIVFLYFLQKKGWFGVERDADWGTGPKNFLRVLFNKEIVSYNNFFNDVLEPLFYEALAKKRDKNYYSRLNCKIPFLNGGLFDPINDYDWVFTDIHIDNEIFSNDFKTKEGDRGNGILDVFDRYNFTVREDEPLEKEVAVDPEMLGKVFENLLEIKDRKSKGTYYTPREIVHYMCQESLVNYLYTELENKVAREDLEILVKKGISYIHNDQSVNLGIKKYEEQIPKIIKKFAPLIDIKLADIKVCDPAVGSGAFLVGMMNEVVNCREVLGYLLNDVKDRNIYKYKRWAIQHSLYGVDIDPSAVEVAKLRLWLSLVVEEDDIKKIKPLPNLDYKIMQGNSLLEEFKGVKLFDEKLLSKNKPVEYDLVAELKQKELELGGKLLAYYQQNPSLMKNRDLKRSLELSKLEMEMDKVRAALKKNNNVKQIVKEDAHQVGLDFTGNVSKEDIWLRLKKLYSRYFKSYDSDKKKQIRASIEKVIWELIEISVKDEGKEEYLKEINIYKNNGIRPFFLWKLYFADVFQERGGFDVVIANPPYIRIQNIKQELAANIKKTYQSATGKFDLYVCFIEKGYHLVNDRGSLCYINPNKFFNATYGIGIRNFIYNNKSLFKLIDFSSNQIFDSATTYTCILMLTKANQNKFNYKKVDEKQDFNDMLNRSGWTTKEIRHLKKDSWTFTDNITQDLLDKFKNFKALGDVCSEIFQGIISGGDKYFFLEKIKEDKEFFYCRSSINGKTYMLEKGICFPLIKGNGIKKYKAPKVEFITIFPYEICSNGETCLYEEKKIASLFNNTYRYLLEFKKELMSRGSSRMEYENWYSMWCPRTLAKFKSIKILTQVLAKNSNFTLDDNSSLFVGGGNAGVYGIIPKTDINIKFLLALLNSRLLDFILKKNTSKFRGGYFSYAKRFIEKIPIIVITKDKQKPFIEIVEQIINITSKSDYSENTQLKDIVHEEEEKLNRLVYKLYDVNEKEIQIIEQQN
ncbi:MAG: Eco57I restriction-modification methylase domain-containing protein [Patescibacteria group bacterium]|jgi:hypothetical protein